MTDLTSPPYSPEPSPVHAALIAAEATMRHNDEVSAVFVVTPGVPGSPDLPRDVVTILRVAAPDVRMAGMDFRKTPYAHIPHWARTLLDSTEGVR